MTIFQRLFPKAVELDRAAKRIDVLDAENVELRRKNSNLWDSYSSANNRAEVLAKESADLKAKIRKQTEADLLLVSMQIQKRILEGEKIETSSGLQALYAQQQSLASNLSPYSGYMSQLGGLGQALGLGSVFGGRGY